MLKYAGCLFLAVCLFLCGTVCTADAEQAFPRPVGAVNDFAGVIPADQKAEMESLAREVLEKTGTAIVVAIVPTIGDAEVSGYVNELYSSWAIGKKGEDKGVLLFVAVKERKMRIETGYGVEGILPDGLVGEIRDKYMVPFLHDGDYGQGLLNGMTAIASVIAKKAGVELTGQPTVKRHAPQSRTGSGIHPWTIVVIAIVLVLVLGTRQGRDLLPFLLGFFLGGGGRGGDGSSGGGFDDFGGGFDGFGGGSSGGGGAGGDY